MKRIKRTFTQDEKDLAFKLQKQGTGFSDIGRIFKAAPGTVFTALRESGGIKPKPQTRNIQHLTLAERDRDQSRVVFEDVAKSDCSNVGLFAFDYLQRGFP